MAIKVFDSTGHYLYNIGKLGLTKGAFIRLENMVYYDPHHSLMVLVNNPTKICEFALDGTLLKETALPFWSTAVQFPSENKCLFYVNQNKSELSGYYNLIETDSLFKIRSKFIDMPKNITATIKFSGGLFYKNGQVIFNPAFSNVYYRIDQDTLKEIYKTDYGSKNLPVFQTQPELFEGLGKYSYQFFGLYSAGKYFGFNYKNGGIATAFYNVQSRNLLTADLRSDSLNSLFCNPMFQSGDDVIMILNFDKIRGMLKRKYQELSERFPSFCSNLKLDTTDHGPKLIVFKLK